MLMPNAICDEIICRPMFNVSQNNALIKYGATETTALEISNKLEQTQIGSLNGLRNYIQVTLSTSFASRTSTKLNTNRISVTITALLWLLLSKKH